MVRSLRNKMCEDLKAHVSHPWTGPRGGSNWCPGHRMGLWRSVQKYYPAKIKEPYSYFEELSLSRTVHVIQPEGEHRILWYLTGVDADRLPGPRRMGMLEVVPLCQGTFGAGMAFWLPAINLLVPGDIGISSPVCENCLNIKNRLPL